MQLILPTTLLVLLSTRLASAVPLTPQAAPSVSTSNCGIVCQLSHLSNGEPTITSTISTKPNPIVENADVHEVKSIELQQNGITVGKLDIDITHTTSSSPPLHQLPKEEQASFWTTEHASRRHREKKKGCHNKAGYVYLPGNIYIPSDNTVSHKMDLVVMSVVVFVLVLLVCVEAAGTIKRQITAAIHSRCVSTPAKLKQGDIFLPADQLPHASTTPTTILEKDGLDGYPREHL